MRDPLKLGPALIVIALATGMITSGCGRGGSLAGPSAAATAQAFATALEAGRFDQAATAFDYIQDARRQNENWDEIPSGQRNQIIRKLQQEKASELGTLKQRLGNNIRCGAPQGGTVTLTGDAGSLSLELAESGGKWYITNIW